jgi:hypothetical protein
VPNLRPSVLALSWSDAAAMCAAASCPASDDVAFAVQTFGFEFSCVPYTFVWNFGDGTTLTSSTPAATHPYTVAGAYNVTVHISRPYGQQVDLTRALAIVGVVPTLSNSDDSRPGALAIDCGALGHSPYLLIANAGSVLATVPSWRWANSLASVA